MIGQNHPSGSRLANSRRAMGVQYKQHSSRRNRTHVICVLLCVLFSAVVLMLRTTTLARENLNSDKDRHENLGILDLTPEDLFVVGAKETIEKSNALLDEKSSLSSEQLAQLHLARGRAFMHVQRHAAALREFDEALKIRPGDPDTIGCHGSALASLDKLEDAARDFCGIIDRRPECSSGYVLMALLKYQSGDMASCLEYALKGVAIDGENPEPYFLCGLANYYLGRFNQSYVDINHCIVKGGFKVGTPNAALPYIYRGLLKLENNNNPQAALRDLLLARQLDRAPGTGLFELAKCYMITGKFHVAYRLGTELIKHKPDERNTADLIIIPCLIQNNEMDQAMLEANEMIVRDPNCSGGYAMRALIQLTMEHFEEAQLDFEKALVLGETNLQAMCGNAYLLATCPVEKYRNGKAAVQLALKACEKTSFNNPRVIMLLAMAHAENGDFQEAVRWGNKSLEKLGAQKNLEREYRSRLRLFEQRKPVRLRPKCVSWDYLRF